MLGGQQFRAYKTIMTKSRYLPRHSVHDVRLFRVIAWGAVIILSVFIAAIVAAQIARFEYESEPVFPFVIPIALGLLFCWWWIDVAPVISRWLVLCVAFTVLFACAAFFANSFTDPEFAWSQQYLDEVQLAALLIYLAVVSRDAWRQIRAGVGKPAEPENA